MASPMPAHSSGWNNTSVAGDADDYGVQTKFMNCTKISLRFSFSVPLALL